MKKKWECINVANDKVKEIAKKYNISEMLATIFINRNIVDEKVVRKFLEPTRHDFYDPFLLPNMEKAVNRIIDAINKKEKVVIYGDYDVDGITSVTVLKKFLSDRGLEADYYIPRRLEEGYGLNNEAVKKLVDEKYSLMVTVDCGISSIEEIEYANSLNLETIITDHHEPLDKLPNAMAVVNPKISTSKYPFNQLAGVGVVFKFIQAIGKKLEIDENEYLKYMDLVCVGTISDIVPLVDENRVITKLGMKLIKVTKNKGLKALIESSGCKEITSYIISFGIAPRINACGRMGYQDEAARLFLSDNEEEVKKLTLKLNEYNKQRQETEKEIFKQALEMLDNTNESNNAAIVLGHENWHHGVIGIVSSKITEMYYKPSILLCFENDIAKGSGRSIQGFDLHSALCNCSNYLEKYGGHEMAVGLNLKRENYEKFKEEFIEYAKKQNIDKFVPVLSIDGTVTSKDINVHSIKELELLEPFGEGNRLPLFVYRNLKIDSIRAITEEKHIKMTLRDTNLVINAIGFNMGSIINQYTIGDKVDVVGAIEINKYNGREQIQINLKDIMKSI